MYYERISFPKQDSITAKLVHWFEAWAKKPTLFAEQISVESINAQVPDLIEQCCDLGWQLDIARLFCTPGHGIMPVHVDGNQLNPKYWALNWPIFNCDKSEMIWYDLPSDYLKKINSFDHYGSDLSYNDDLPDDGFIVERCVIDQPTCVKIDVPHSVINHSFSSRILLSLRFKDHRHWK